MDQRLTRMLREFCVREFAYYISQNSVCLRSPRADTDWLTAERYLEEKPFIVEDVINTERLERNPAENETEIKERYRYRIAEQLSGVLPQLARLSGNGYK